MVKSGHKNDIKPQRSVKSAARVMEVLEYFKRNRRSESMGAIAAALGYPVSSTSVLLKTLAQSGYLNYNSQKRVYFPTLRLAALGAWVPEAIFGESKLLDALNYLHETTGEGVALCTPNDIYLQYEKVTRSSMSPYLAVREGSLRLLIHSAIGWVLLSSYDDEKIELLVRRANIASSKEMRVDLRAIMENIRLVRRNRYCWFEDVPVQGVGTMCVLLPGQLRNQPVAMSLGGPKERLYENRQFYLSAMNAMIEMLSLGRRSIDLFHPYKIEDVFERAS